VLAPTADYIIHVEADAAAFEIEDRRVHLGEPHVPEMHVPMREPALRSVRLPDGGPHLLGDRPEAADVEPMLA
jgi:hypothetical protein